MFGIGRLTLRLKQEGFNDPQRVPESLGETLGLVTLQLAML